MSNKNLSIKDVKYWSRMSLSSADEVLLKPSGRKETYRSSFSDLYLDLNAPFPDSFARTLTGKRFELSVLECDLEVLEEFIEYIDELREEGKKGNYQIGYLRDFNHGKPQMMYARVECDGEVREVVF